MLQSVSKIWVAAPSYHEQKGHPHVCEDLTIHACLVNTTTDPDGIWKIGKQKVKVNAVLKCANPLILIDAAVAGLGILRVSFFYVEPLLAEKQLIKINLPNEDEHSTVYVCYPSLHKKDKVRLLVDQLLRS